MTRDDWRRRHVAVHAKLVTKRIPTCHPEREHKARGMCDPCYRRWLTAQRRMEHAR